MSATQSQFGFGGQWVEIFKTGTHTDMAGRKHRVDAAFLESVVAHYDDALHEAPAVIGHPETDAPAYAYVGAMRARDGSLEVQFVNTDAEFEEMVRAGRFKKRSPAFYVDPQTAPGGRVPYLRHVGFLGAQPPAVKGLRPIQFSEGRSLAFEIQFSEGEDSMNDSEVKTVGDRLVEYFKSLFGGDAKSAPSTAQAAPGVAPPAPAQFSEADLDTRIKNAVEAATASFGEKITKLEEENTRLRERTDQHSVSAQRTEIAAFCERLGAGRFLPAFRHMGVIEFMETLATIPEKKVSVISFAEENGKSIEKKEEIAPLDYFKNFLSALPPFIQFGEQFGDFKVCGNGKELSDPEEMNKLRDGMGTNGMGTNKAAAGGDK